MKRRSGTLRPSACDQKEDRLCGGFADLFASHSHEFRELVATSYDMSQKRPDQRLEIDLLDSYTAMRSD